MPRSPSTRAGITETQREAARLAHTLAATLGADVRAARLRLRLPQRELGRRIGLRQSRVSQIERGRGAGASLQAWVALGVALERPFAATLSRPLGEASASRDAGHLELQELLLELAARTGRSATFELPTRPQDPRRSTDVGVRDDVRRLLILEEAWNTFGDLGDAVRSTRRKVTEAERLAVAIGGDHPYRVASVWVVRDTAANRALVRRYPRIFDDALPGSSRRWVDCLVHGGDPPSQPGLAWVDPGTGRISEWRRQLPEWRRQLPEWRRRPRKTLGSG
jgi:transcriptional regulator with XRE-family HTH domain